MKNHKKGIPPQRKREVKKYDQTVSVDLEEVNVFVEPSSNLMSIITSNIKMTSNSLFFYQAFDVRYTVGFFFSKKYDTTKKRF